MKKIITSLVCLFPLFVFAQYGNVWCFGYHNGLDFNTNPPSRFDTSKVYTVKGSASVCDINGQLLFYTDGRKVWNKLYQQMPNGHSMAFNALYLIDTTATGENDSLFFSSDQAAVILPIEGTSKYYIFTTDFYGAINQLKYHIIDMSLENGLGDVVIKNQILQNEMSEKLTATRHCNGQDWWVVSRKRTGDEYYTYLVTQDSVITNAVISHSNTFSLSSDCCGFIKISPNGEWIAASYEGAYGGVELSLFDNATGQINVVMQDFIYGWKSSFTNSFSADSKYLYSATQYQDSTSIDSLGNFAFYQFIDRYSLINADSLQILQSKTQLLQPDSMRNCTAMQLAPDGNVYARGLIYDETNDVFTSSKLYLIKPLSDSLISTQFVYPSENFIGTPFGLPSFPDAIFTNHHKASLRIPTCVAGVFDSIPFYDSLLTTTRDYIWDFGDPASGVNNTYNGQFPIHNFSAQGTYTVTLTLPSDCNPISVSMQVTATSTVANTPVISLNSFFLESTQAAQYQWYLNNVAIVGANNQTFTPIVNGNYAVVITDTNNCMATSNVFNLTNVGLKTNNPNNFTVFPNPAKETLHISNPNKKQAQVIVYSLIGKPLLQYQLSNASETIDISSLANGIYILKIDNQFNQKIVINK
jgi:hypothetical protein